MLMVVVKRVLMALLGIRVTKECCVREQCSMLHNRFLQAKQASGASDGVIKHRTPNWNDVYYCKRLQLHSHRHQASTELPPPPPPPLPPQLLLLMLGKSRLISGCCC